MRPRGCLGCGECYRYPARHNMMRDIIAGIVALIVTIFIAHFVPMSKAEHVILLAVLLFGFSRDE